MSTIDKAMLITQYERYGTVGVREYIDYFIDEELEVSIDMFDAYNEYLSEFYPDSYIYDDLEMMADGMGTIDFARRIYFGNFNFVDDYYRFNGYGNIDSLTDHEIVREMRGDRDFLEWYINMEQMIDYDDLDECVKKANELIASGY